MDIPASFSLSVSDDFAQLLALSDSCNLEDALDHLIHTSKTNDGRLELASKFTILPVLKLCQVLSPGSCQHLLLLSLKLLRNLCAGEIRNQNLFIEQNGVGFVSTIASCGGLDPAFDPWIIRIVLQILGNVSLAGAEHQDAVWNHFFPVIFQEIARLRSKEICDPLCMVIHTCSFGGHKKFTDLCKNQGIDIIVDIIRTITIAGFEEHWVKILLSRICLEEHYLSSVFYKLFPAVLDECCNDSVCGSRVNHFLGEQAFLLGILSQILNERLEDITVSNDSALCILKILRNAVELVDFTKKGKSCLPTGDVRIDVFGYSLTILRDICACDTRASDFGEKEDAVDVLVSSGLIELLLSLLHDLQLPAIIQKAMMQNKSNDDTVSKSTRQCPYKGFRSDVVAVIGNGAYRRPHVQNKIREQDGILLLLQQSVTDEDNPFLREWGIWSMRNILEGNTENQQLVSNLELQGSVRNPEVEQMGLRVEVDPKTQRAKLVNL